MKDKTREAIIELGDGTRWVIVHNLPDAFGMNIEGAINNYLVRADNPTAQGFCNYIKSKDPNFKAWPKANNDKKKK